MKAYFFDLDGTLSDSRAGLYPAFRSGLQAIGIDAIGDDGLATFLGTPLPKMFRTLKPEIGQDQIDAGIAAFRKTFEQTGTAGNDLYPGVIELLADVVGHGGVAWVVTSKPEMQAIRIVRHFKLDPYLGGVVGAGLAELDTKTELVARALSAAGVDSTDAMMLGDRHYDVIGALANHVTPVGALWGYGSRLELETAGCTAFAASPDDFRRHFVDLSAATVPAGPAGAAAL